jgi:hypothetical protein
MNQCRDRAIVHLESPTSRKQKKLAVEQTECWDRLPSLLPEFHRDLHGPGFLPARAINSHPSLRGCERRRSAPHSKILSDASRVQLKAWEPASSLNSQQPDAAGIPQSRLGFQKQPGLDLSSSQEQIHPLGESSSRDCQHPVYLLQQEDDSGQVHPKQTRCHTPDDSENANMTSMTGRGAMSQPLTAAPHP